MPRNRKSTTKSSVQTVEQQLAEENALLRKELAERDVVHKLELKAKDLDHKLEVKAMDVDHTLQLLRCADPASTSAQNEFAKLTQLATGASASIFSHLEAVDDKLMKSVWKDVKEFVRLPPQGADETPFYHNTIKAVLLCADPFMHPDHKIIHECKPADASDESDEKPDEEEEVVVEPLAKRARVEGSSAAAPKRETATQKKASKSNKRCDFVMAVAYDAEATLRSMLLSLEVKRILYHKLKASASSAPKSSGPSAAGGNKICNGIAQAKRYAVIALSRLYKTMNEGCLNLRTYAAFTNCYSICFICAELSNIGTIEINLRFHQTALMPFLVTAIPEAWKRYAKVPTKKEVSFEPGTTLSNELATSAPSGFRFLARLLATSAAGLGATPLPSPALTIGKRKLLLDTQLGSGGYGNVFVGTINGNRVAVKVPRLDRDSAIQNERKILRLLAKHGRPSLFQVCKSTPTAQFPFHPPVRALITTPVGIPLLQYVQAHPKIPRRGLAAQVCTDILKALELAHKENVVHGDIRPVNVIALDPPMDGAHFMLIDWGCGVVLKPGAKAAQRAQVPYHEYAVYEAGGKDPYSTVSKFSKDGDLLSVVYLYCAIVFGGEWLLLPWQAGLSFTAGMHSFRKSVLIKLAEADPAVAAFSKKLTYTWPSVAPKSLVGSIKVSNFGSWTSWHTH
jgi:hypothetical protein